MSQDPVEVDSVMAVNLAYYKALSARDMRAMKEVWTRAQDNILIAPPGKPVTHIGWADIERNWEGYWPTFSEYEVIMAAPKVSINGPVAWVHGVEKSRRKTIRGEVSAGSNFGTNIFVKHTGRWLMVFHQSLAMPSEGSAAAGSRESGML